MRKNLKPKKDGGAIASIVLGFILAGIAIGTHELIEIIWVKEALFYIIGFLTAILMSIIFGEK